MRLLGLLLIVTPFVLNVEAQSLPLPYYTGFDSTSQQAGWQEFRLGVSSSFNWGYSVSNLVSSPNSLFHDYNVGGSATDTVEDWFVSPPLKLTKPALLNLKLFAQYLSSDSSEYAGIWFGENSNDPVNGEFYEIANLTNMQSLFQWVDTSFMINTVTDSGYLAFKYINTADDWFQIFIDDINLTSEDKGSIDSLIMIPANPTTNDSVKVICYTSFPNSGCLLKNSSFNVNNGVITVNATHFEGGGSTICNSIDTIVIGELDTGAYDLLYYLSVDTNSAVFDMDTLYFLVQNPTVVLKLPNETTPIKVYPNPTTGQFTVELYLKHTGNVSVELFQVNGRQVFADKVMRTVGGTSRVIDLNGFSKGIYYLQVLMDNTIVTQKIVLQ